MMVKSLLVIILAFTLIACSSPDDATRVLKAQGFTHIQTRGAFFGCGRGEVFRTRFTAKSVTGESVTGVVCSGWLKGSTIRYD